jgi:hypothetical protein
MNALTFIRSKKNFESSRTFLSIILMFFELFLYILEIKENFT